MAPNGTAQPKGTVAGYLQNAANNTSAVLTAKHTIKGPNTHVIPAAPTHPSITIDHQQLKYNYGDAAIYSASGHRPNTLPTNPAVNLSPLPPTQPALAATDIWNKYGAVTDAHRTSHDTHLPCI